MNKVLIWVQKIVAQSTLEGTVAGEIQALPLKIVAQSTLEGTVAGEIQALPFFNKLPSECPHQLLHPTWQCQPLLSGRVERTQRSLGGSSQPTSCPRALPPALMTQPHFLANLSYLPMACPGPSHLSSGFLQGLGMPSSPPMHLHPASLSSCTNATSYPNLLCCR